jgi:carbamate kinase
MRAGHRLVVTHGNGPQIGLLALQAYAYRPDDPFPLDVLGAETEGMIGYLVEQELRNQGPKGQRYATLLTQICVDRDDPAFEAPAKPVGPVYERAEADRLGRERGWAIVADGPGWRRAVPSPRPRAVLGADVLAMLCDAGVTIVCAGGGGIPVVEAADGTYEGVEAVIDKDHASALLACTLRADALLLLTDVDAVYRDWGTAHAAPVRDIDATALARMELPAGSMGPKAAAACDFATATGAVAGIGRLTDALAILTGAAGTLVHA